MQFRIKYRFEATIWRYSGQAGWYFVSLPQSISDEIRANLGWQEEGWGRMQTMASIDNFEWKTAIWYDKRRSTYLLPIKASIRTKLSLELDQMIAIEIGL